MRDNIPDHVGYHISRDGTVYSRWSKSGVGLLKTYRPLSIRYTNNGRCYVSINSIKRKIHRLVAQVYIPNPNNYPYVCHKDNNPKNNHVDNLYWGTQSMNLKQACEDGRHKNNLPKPRSGVDNFNAKLDWQQVEEIRELRKKGFFLKELAKLFNISIGSISRITKNKSYKK